MSSDEEDIVFKKKGKKDKAQTAVDGVKKTSKLDDFLKFDDEEPISFASRTKKDKKVKKEDKESDHRAKLMARLLAAEAEEEAVAKPPISVYKAPSRPPQTPAFCQDTFDPFAMATNDYDSTNTAVSSMATSLEGKYGASASVVYGRPAQNLDANSNEEPSLAQIDETLRAFSALRHENFSTMRDVEGVTLTLAELEAGDGTRLGLAEEDEEDGEDEGDAETRLRMARRARMQAKDTDVIDLTAFNEEEMVEWTREEARDQDELLRQDDAIADAHLYDTEWSYEEHMRPADALSKQTQKRREMIKKAVSSSSTGISEHPDWESEVIRAATSNSGFLRYGQAESNSNAALPSSRPISLLATGGVPSEQTSPAFAMDALWQALEEAQESHKQEKEDVQRFVWRAEEDGAEWEAERGKAERARDAHAAEWEYYQRASAWFSTLCDCVGIKATTASALRARLCSIRARAAEERTRTALEGWEWVEEGLWGLKTRGVDAFGRDLSLVKHYQRKEQEKQRLRAGWRSEGVSRVVRQWNESNRTNSHAVGYSTDAIGYSTDEEEDAAGENGDLLRSFRVEATHVRDKVRVLFSDAAEEYVGMEPMLDRLASWKRQYLDTYIDTHMPLSLPYLVLAHISQNVLNWAILSAPRLHSMPWYDTLLKWTDQCVEQTSRVLSSSEESETSGKIVRKAHWEFECDPDEDLIPTVVALWVGGFVSAYVADARWCRTLCSDAVIEGSEPHASVEEKKRSISDSTSAGASADMGLATSASASTGVAGKGISSQSVAMTDAGMVDSDVIVLNNDELIASDQIVLDSDEEERATRRRRTRAEMEADAAEEERWASRGASGGGEGVGAGMGPCVSSGLGLGMGAGLGYTNITTSTLGVDHAGMGDHSAVSAVVSGGVSGFVSATKTDSVAGGRPDTGHGANSSGVPGGVYERAQERMGQIWDQAISARRRAGLGLGSEPTPDRAALSASPSSSYASSASSAAASTSASLSAPRVLVGKMSFVRASGGDTTDMAMQAHGSSGGNGSGNTAGESDTAKAAVYIDVTYPTLPLAHTHAQPSALARVSPIYSLPLLVADILMHAHPSPTLPLPPPSRALHDRSLPLARMLSSVHASILQQINFIVGRRMLTHEHVPDAPSPLEEAASLAKWRVTLRNFHAAIKTLRIATLWRHLFAHMGGSRTHATSTAPSTSVTMTSHTVSRVDASREWFNPYQDKHVITSKEPSSMRAITKHALPTPPQAFTSSEEHRIPLDLLSKALPCHTHMATQVLVLPLLRMCCLPLLTAMSKQMNRCLAIQDATYVPAQPLHSQPDTCMVAAETVWRLWALVLALEVHACIPVEWGQSGNTPGAGVVAPDVDDYRACPHLSSSFSFSSSSCSSAIAGVDVCDQCLHCVQYFPVHTPTTGIVSPSIFTRMYGVTKVVAHKFGSARHLLSRLAHYIMENSTAATEATFTVSTRAWAEVPFLLNALASGQWEVLAEADQGITGPVSTAARAGMEPDNNTSDGDGRSSAASQKDEGRMIGLGDLECIRIVRMVSMVARGELDRGIEELV